MEETTLLLRPSLLQPPSPSPQRRLRRLPNSCPPPPSLLLKGAPLPFPQGKSPPPAIDAPSPFQEKMLFLDSAGVDLFPLVENHPPILSSTLAELRAAVYFLLSLGFSAADLRRMCGMCPEILTAGGPSSFNPVLTFLLREAGVRGGDLRRIISRRPRLLVSDVSGRLRPTLDFLRMLGIAETARHAHLLSCSVEEKFIPRLDFLQEIGFSPRDARSMARRFPHIFCYSITENLMPKFRFFAGEMGRDMAELRNFPQYFSFSLEKKIKPRCLLCKEKEVFFELPALLKPSDGEFRRRLQVSTSSSPPVRRSPLWRQGLGDDYL